MFTVSEQLCTASNVEIKFQSLVIFCLLTSSLTNAPEAKTNNGQFMRVQLYLYELHQLFYFYRARCDTCKFAALLPAYDRPMACVLWRPFSSLSCYHGRHDPDGTDVCDGVVIKQNHHLSNICAREQQCLLTADGQLFTVQRLFSVQLLGKAVCHSGSGEINLPKPCVGPAVGWTQALCGMFTGMEGYSAGVLTVRTYASVVRCALHVDGVVQCAMTGFKLRVCVPPLKSGRDPS